MADDKNATEKAEATAPAKKPAAKKPAAAKPAAEKAAPKAAAKKPAAKAEPKAAAAKAAPKAEPKAAAKKPAAEKTEAVADKAAPKVAAQKPVAESAERVSTLKMHHLRPAAGAHKSKIRVGRGEGGKRGKTAGRGTKGTGARYQVPASFEGGQTPIHMRIPKLRGFKSPFKVYYQVVNVAQIEELFPKGGKVTKADLVDRGAVRKNQPVKVLGDGEISVKVTIVDADKVSQSAKTKIEAAGGSVN